MNDLRGDVRRMLRMLDGDGPHDGLAVRLDRLEASAKRNAERIERVAGIVREGNPLMDVEIAQRVIEHVERGDGTTLMQRRVFGFVARELVTIGLQIATIVVLGYLATHGVPVAQLR